MCWHGGTMTLDEFRKEINNIKERTFELFKNNDGNSVYGVVLTFMDDEGYIIFETHTKLFKNFLSVRGYIRERYLFEEEDQEPIENHEYWAVTKYCPDEELDEYYEDITCYFSVDMKLLSVCLNNVCRNNSQQRKFLPEAKEFENHKYLLTGPKNIDVPYKTGDILKVTALPSFKIFYVVYGGEKTKGEREEGLKNKWDCYSHWCIYESEKRKGLWIDDLSSDGFTDYVCFLHCPLDMCELVKECPDEKIMRVSKILKANPEKWYEWISLKDKLLDDIDASLDAYIE